MKGGLAFGSERGILAWSTIFLSLKRSVSFSPCHRQSFSSPRHAASHLPARQTGRTSDDDATLESLADQLSRRLLESDDPESRQLEVLTTRLPLQLNRTSVGLSSIAGRGLFATQDCSAGDLLTCYPGDALIRTPSAASEEKGDWTYHWGKHVDVSILGTWSDQYVEDIPENEEEDDDNESNTMFQYILSVTDDFGILGVPVLDSDPAYFGHFANDGATMPLSEQDLATYVIESNERRNAMHKGVGGDSHMVTVATRKIAAGDEIFVTYGPDYWREQSSFSSTPTTKEEVSKPTSTGKGFG